MKPAKNESIDAVNTRTPDLSTELRRIDVAPSVNRFNYSSNRTYKSIYNVSSELVFRRRLTLMTFYNFYHNRLFLNCF